MAQTLPTSRTLPSGKTGNDPEPPLIDLPGVTEAPPPGGLEQIGDGPFWGSPVEPVEPTDCERWPSSPYCGENPIGDKFVDLGVELSSDSCSVCISISPTLGLISLPPLIYCYIKPECQIPPEPPILPQCLNSDNVFDTSEELQNQILGGYEPTNNDLIEPCDDTPNPPFGDGQIVTIKVYQVQQNVSCGTTNCIISPVSRSLYWTVTGKNDFEYKFQRPSSAPSTFIQTTGDGIFYTGYQVSNYRFPGDKVYENSNGQRLYIPVNTAGYSILVSFFRGQPSDKARTAGWIKTELYINDVLVPPPPLPPLPPPPVTPTTPREPEMKCNCNRIEEMLKLLLKRMGNFPANITTPNKDKTKKQKIASVSEALTKWSEAQSTDFSEVYKVLEPRSFEKASYPMSLTHPGAKGNKPIRNFLQAWEVILRQIDKVNGAFPFKIRIKDTNPAQKGDQSLELEIWSIADAFKLIIQNIIDTEGDVDINNNLLVRMGSMLIQQHQVLARINATTQNTEEYLDYKVKQKVISLPSTLNPLLPPENQGFGQAKKIDENTEEATESMLPHFMKNTYLKVKVTQIDEKRLLGERLYSIEKHATNAAAGNTVHYGGEGTLKNLIEGAMQIADMEDYLLRENVRKAIGKDKTELKDFEKQVEKGYPEAIGKSESNIEKPYGRPQSKAPKVKRTKRMK